MTIAQTDEKMEIPVDEFDGKVTYGEKRKQEGKRKKREKRRKRYDILRRFSLSIKRSHRYFSSNSE